MVGKMTSWTLQTAVAGLTAVILLYPTPRDLVEALQLKRNPSPAEIIMTRAPRSDVVITTSSEPTSVEAVVAYDPAADCLHRFQNEGIEVIDRCIVDLYVSIRAADQTIIDEPGDSPRLDPTVEAERVALSKLCRARWTASNGDMDTLNSDACRYALEGIAY